MARLVESARIGPTWRGLTGEARAMLYCTAAGTGFRASELRSLTPGAFDLQSDPPTVTVEACTSKRRRRDVQPMRADLGELLRGWLRGKARDAALWPGGWHKKAAVMLRADLRRARARWIRETIDPAERRRRRASAFLAESDEAGRVVDFHALRATYITALVTGGASAKEAQTLARHSTPSLTLNVYTRLGMHDLAGALSKLPPVAAPDGLGVQAMGRTTEKANAGA